MVVAVRFKDDSSMLDGAAVDEAESPTTVRCRFCLAEAKGPQEPWCCEGRKNHFAAKVFCGEHPVFTGK